MNISTFFLSASNSTGFWDFLSSRVAIGVYIAIIMILIAILSVHVLNVIRLLDGKEVSVTGSKNSASKAVGDGRFNMLNRIDAALADYERPTEEKITLEELCHAFRDYAAGNLGLYYDISDIRRFIAGMSVTRLILLQGMSGTGKTI